MILEILKYVLSDFYRFCGFSMLFYVALHYLCNTVIQLFKAIKAIVLAIKGK